MNQHMSATPHICHNNLPTKYRYAAIFCGYAVMKDMWCNSWGGSLFFDFFSRNFFRSK